VPVRRDGLYRALTALPGREASGRVELDSRDQARRLSADGAAGEPAGIRLLTRNAHEWTDRYPAVVAAMNHLPVTSCLIDRGVVACDENGLAVFDLLRRGPRRKSYAVLIAFDLPELDGTDLRRKPIEERKRRLAEILRNAKPVCS